MIVSEPDVEYEGFTNRNTFEIAHCIVNTQSLATIVRQGMHISCRRQLGYSPRTSSYPFITSPVGGEVAEISTLVTLFISKDVIPKLKEDCGGVLEDFEQSKVNLKELKFFLIEQYYKEAIAYARKNRYL